MDWTQFFYVIGLAFAGWLVYRQIKTNPKAFSSKNLGKSVYTLGWLALLLIGFITVLVLLLR